MTACSSCRYATACDLMGRCLAASLKPVAVPPWLAVETVAPKPSSPVLSTSAPMPPAAKPSRADPWPAALAGRRFEDDARAVRSEPFLRMRPEPVVTIRGSTLAGII